MPAHPMSGPDPSKPASSALGRALARSEEVFGEPPDTNFESDFAELAAKFSAHSGGAFSSELSSELALEIVFNEIVEQACLATGATGAAVVLERDGEMICRATSGFTAPDLGSRLDRSSGLSGECIRTREVVCCDDALTDPRADMDASRRLGVRSVMVLPLLRDEVVVGVLEAFSARPGAFGERDERTLQALAQRVLKNLARAAEPVAAPVEVLADIAENNVATVSDSGVEVAEEAPETVTGPGGEWRFDFVTWTLGAAVLACAVLLGVLVGQRMGWQRASAHVRSGNISGNSASVPARSSPGGTAAGNSSSAVIPVASAKTNSAGIPVTGSGSKTSTPASNHASTDSIPAGSLRVYENGKEVFRLPASENLTEPNAKTGSGMERAASVEPVVELSAAAAEGSLLHRVEPEYPEPARQQQIEGPVALEVRIGPDGAVQDIKVLSGAPLLAEAATDAVKQWRFRPLTVDGRQMEMQTKVTLNFRLPH